jgi:xanthine dehydrogenase accessory factor
MSDVIEPRSTPTQLTATIRRVLQENSIAALATLVVAPEGVGMKMLIEETGASTGSLGHATLDDAVSRYATTFLSTRAEAATLSVREFAPQLESSWLDARVLFERIDHEPRIVICGAGHVGAALANLASRIGYRATLIDDRAAFVTRERFPDAGIDLVAASGWTGAVTEAVGSGRGVYVAVVTRGHNEDEECLRAVVKARPDYVGLIGSRRRTNIVLDRLRATGADDEVLKQVRAPIGLDIGAVSPEEVALAILAEIVAERRGGSGRSLSEWRRSYEEKSR